MKENLLHLINPCWQIKITSKAALDELQTFREKWQHKYKYAIASWEENWENLTNYFGYPLELRKIIYTTMLLKT
jgi:putative transposase